MSGLRELLQMRRKEIEHKMVPINTRAAELRTQLAEQDAKLRALTKELNDIERALQAIGKKEKLEATITIKEAILETLRGAPKGMSAADILIAINDRYFDGTIMRTSMSPQLARLKNDDEKIRQMGGKYFLA
jgi:hypothetical protein